MRNLFNTLAFMISLTVFGTLNKMISKMRWHEVICKFFSQAFLTRNDRLKMIEKSLELIL